MFLEVDHGPDPGIDGLPLPLGAGPVASAAGFNAIAPTSAATAAVSTVLVCSTEARAADPVTKLSFSIWQSPDHYMVKGIQRWASEITKRTNGKVEFVFHYGGTLTKGEQAYDGITKGISDAAAAATGCRSW